MGVVMAGGVMLAGIAQLALLVYAVRHMGFSIPMQRPRLTPGVKRLWALGVPGVVAGGVTQINIVVGTVIASTQAGAVSYLYYADRIYQLPLGVVGIAIGVVLLPDLARQLRSGREDIALHTQNRAMEFALALTLPATVALMVIPSVIIAVSVSARCVRRQRYVGDDRGTSRLCGRSAGLCPQQGRLARVFRP